MVSFDTAPAHLRVAAYAGPVTGYSASASELPVNNPYFVEKRDDGAPTDDKVNVGHLNKKVWGVAKPEPAPAPSGGSSNIYSHYEDANLKKTDGSFGQMNPSSTAAQTSTALVMG